MRGVILILEIESGYQGDMDIREWYVRVLVFHEVTTRSGQVLSPIK
jgi:hypothetical protein